MNYLELQQPQRIGIFLEEPLLRLVKRRVDSFGHKQNFSPKDLESLVRTHILEKFGVHQGYSFVSRQLFCDKTLESNANKSLFIGTDPRVEALCLEHHYSSNGSCEHQNSQLSAQASLMMNMSMKVLFDVMTKDLDTVCLLVADMNYTPLINHLKGLGVQLCLFSFSEEFLMTSDQVEALSLQKSELYDEADELIDLQALTQHLQTPRTKLQSFRHDDFLPREESVEVVAETQNILEREEKKDLKTSVEISFNENEEYIGEIANIIKNKGFAFIKRSDQNLFLHRSQMTNPEDFDSLEVGSMLIYKVRCLEHGRIQAVEAFPVAH